MAYSIKGSEPLAKALKRITIEELEAAIHRLRQSDEGSAAAVHGCRKSIKKVRALLRLVRQEIGDDLYRRENKTLRDIASGLSAMRDADVLIDTLLSLRHWAGDRLDGDEAEALEQSIGRHRENLADAGTPDSGAIAKAADLLDDALQRARCWPIERNRFDVIEGGIKRTYRSGRKGYRRILEEPAAENLHEWRKQVKYLWYMCRLISRTLKVSHKDLVDDLDTLAELLGDDRDLELLRALSLEHSPDGCASTMVDLIDERRAELQEKAKSLGTRLYNPKPKKFVKRIREDWERA